MNSLNRILALFLVPCLAADPLAVSAMGPVGADLVSARNEMSARNFGQAQGLSLQIEFTSQALAPEAGQFRPSQLRSPLRTSSILITQLTDDELKQAQEIQALGTASSLPSDSRKGSTWITSTLAIGMIAALPLAAISALAGWHARPAEAAAAWPQAANASAKLSWAALLGAGSLIAAVWSGRRRHKSVFKQVLELARHYQRLSADWADPLREREFEKILYETAALLQKERGVDVAERLVNLWWELGGDERARAAALNHVIFLPFGRFWIYPHPQEKQPPRHDMNFPLFHDSFEVNGKPATVGLFKGKAETGLLMPARLITFNQDGILKTVVKPTDLENRVRGEFYASLGLLKDLDYLNGRNYSDFVVVYSDLADDLSQVVSSAQGGRIQYVAPLLRQVLIAKDRADLIYQLIDLINLAKARNNEEMAWAASFALRQLSHLIGLRLLRLPEDRIPEILDAQIAERDVPTVRRAAHYIFYDSLRLPADGNDPGGEKLPTLSPDGIQVTEDPGMIWCWQGVVATIRHNLKHGRGPMGGPVILQSSPAALMLALWLAFAAMSLGHVPYHFLYGRQLLHEAS